MLARAFLDAHLFPRVRPGAPRGDLDSARTNASGRFALPGGTPRGAAEEEEETVWESTLETLGEATCDLWAEARVALEGFAAATGAALDARPDLAREPTERAEAPAREPAVGALAPPARVPESPWSWYSAAAR